MNVIPVLPYRDAGVITPNTSNDAALLSAAKKLEASFLSEMLKASGFDNFSQGFASGPGQEQFSSFLREAQATEMVDSGGIGLAEALFNALKRSTHV